MGVAVGHDVKINDGRHVHPQHIHDAVRFALLFHAIALFKSFQLPAPHCFMSVSAIALRRAPLFSSSTALPRTRLLAAHLTRPQFTKFSTTSRRMDKDQSRGESTTGISEWKQRPPYRVHDKKVDNFDVKYTANCHCGKVEYELSRREPLDSKLCHCTTCQTQHGEFSTTVTFSRNTDALQPRPSSGQPSSTRMTSTSPTATTTSNGTTRQRSRSSTSCLAKYAARTATAPSWTRAAT